MGMGRSLNPTWTTIQVVVGELVQCALANLHLVQANHVTKIQKKKHPLVTCDPLWEKPRQPKLLYPSA